MEELMIVSTRANSFEVHGERPFFISKGAAGER